MKKPLWIPAVLLGGAMLVWTASSAFASQEAAKPEQPEQMDRAHQACALHDGQVAMTASHHFETVFADDGARVYLYSASQTPMRMMKATGMMTLKFKDGTTKEVPMVLTTPKDGEKTVYFCPMHANNVQMTPGVCEQCGGMKLMKQDYLYGNVDLSGVEPGSVQAVFKIKGMKGDEPEATFAATYGATSTEHQKPMSPAH